MTENITLTVILKNLSYVAVFMVSLEWLGFSPQAMWIFAALMVIDVFTGIIRSARLNGCASIKSSAAKRGLISKILTITALFSVALAGKGVGFDMSGMLQGAVNVFILAELYSILGNIHSARTCEPKVEFDAVAFMLKQVKALLDKLVK